MHRFATLSLLFTHFISYGQIDQKKLDSLKRTIEYSTKTQKSWQDSFVNAQDSIYKSAVTNSGSVNLSTQQETTIKDKQIVVIRIVIFVALFLIAVFLALRQKRPG